MFSGLFHKVIHRICGQDAQRIADTITDWTCRSSRLGLKFEA